MSRILQRRNRSVTTKINDAIIDNTTGGTSKTKSVYDNGTPAMYDDYCPNDSTYRESFINAVIEDTNKSIQRSGINDTDNDDGYEIKDDSISVMPSSVVNEQTLRDLEKFTNDAIRSITRDNTKYEPTYQ